MLDIEWSGKSYTDEIENLSTAFDAARERAERYCLDLETVWNIYQADIELEINGTAATVWSDFEAAFAAIAFKGWITEPDGWSLVCR